MFLNKKLSFFGTVLCRNNVRKIFWNRNKIIKTLSENLVHTTQFKKLKYFFFKKKFFFYTIKYIQNFFNFFGLNDFHKKKKKKKKYFDDFFSHSFYFFSNYINYIIE